MPRSLAVLLLLAATISAQSQNVDVRLEPLPRGTYIVELQRAPGVAAAATLERFRRDLPATFPKRRLQTQSAALAIRDEYAHALLGAAILFAYKVLDSGGSGWQSDVIAAIERSIREAADGDSPAKRRARLQPAPPPVGGRGHSPQDPDGLKPILRRAPAAR